MYLKCTVLYSKTRKVCFISTVSPYINILSHQYFRAMADPSFNRIYKSQEWLGEGINCSTSHIMVLVYEPNLDSCK